MLTQQVSSSTAANASGPNILPPGMQVVGRPSRLTIYGNTRALGPTINFTMTLGGDQRNLIPGGSTLSLASSVGTVKKNEDLIGQWVIPPGAVLSVILTNPTGGAITSDLLFALEP